MLFDDIVAKSSPFRNKILIEQVIILLTRVTQVELITDSSRNSS